MEEISWLKKLMQISALKNRYGMQLVFSGGHIPAAEYRKVIVGLIFLRYISSAFDRKYQELVAEGDGFEDDKDAYTMDNIFFVPEEARLINTAHGAVQQCLFISDIKDFPIDIPDRHKLCEFDSIVAPMFNAISRNQEENQNLAELRDTLLPKLMNGEIDVSEVKI